MLSSKKMKKKQLLLALFGALILVQLAMETFAATSRRQGGRRHGSLRRLSLAAACSTRCNGARAAFRGRCVESKCESSPGASSPSKLLRQIEASCDASCEESGSRREEYVKTCKDRCTRRNCKVECTKRSNARKIGCVRSCKKKNKKKNGRKPTKKGCNKRLDPVLCGPDGDEWYANPCVARARSDWVPAVDCVPGPMRPPPGAVTP